MRKIFLFVTAALCSATMAFADEDTRTVISECAFTGAPAPVEAGQTWSQKWSTYGGCFTPTTPSIYHVSQYMYLNKKDGESWHDVNDNTVITEGVYRYELQLRIDGDYNDAQNSYRLQNDGTLTMTVDGVNWRVTSVTVFNGPTYYHSYVWVYSPEMTVEKVTLPLQFSFQNTLNYTVNYLNKEITEKDLKNFTTGGTEEYTFTKITNNAPWFNVSSEGILSGTPTELSMKAVRDSVRLSDGEKDTIISLYVGPVAPLPANREVVSEITFTNFNTPAVGDINTESNRDAIIHAIERPEGALYRLSYYSVDMRRKDGDNFVLMGNDEAFTVGTYQMQGQLRLDVEYSFGGYFYVLDHEDNITATIDGKPMQISSGYTGDTYSYRYYSYEFTISPPTAIENTTDAPKAVKRIVNGQLIILRDGKTFNALGAQMK